MNAHPASKFFKYFLTTIGLFACLSALAQASEGGTDPVLVTDTAELTAQGFTASATNVYRDGSGHYFRLRTEGDTRNSANDPSVTTNIFGTASFGFATGQPGDATPRDETQQWDLEADFGAEFDSGSALTCPSGENDGEFIVPIVGLPQGANIDAFLLRGFDNNGLDLLDAVLKKVCQSKTGTVNAPDITNLTGDIGSTMEGTPGNFEAEESGIDDTVDNKFCHYHALVDLEASACRDNDIAFHKVRVQWQRQIASAPGTATFNDVPTTHTFFKEIEALVDSGITGGCGGGNYCPDDTLTRGQMAAFLARALGLHFPGCTNC